MNKKELRKKYKELRQQLTEDALVDKSLAIANRTLQLNVWDKTYYHLFLTIEEQKEIDTEFVLQILAGKDKEIVVSKSDFETFEMTHFLLTDNTKFRTNSYHIPEPIDGLEVPASKIEVVFVPLLAFDEKDIAWVMAKVFTINFCPNASQKPSKLAYHFLKLKQLSQMPTTTM